MSSSVKSNSANSGVSRSIKPGGRELASGYLVRGFGFGGGGVGFTAGPGGVA